MVNISIIVPFFNASNTICATLNSIRKQTYEDYECLLINDESYDDSLSIVKKYITADKRFKLLSQEKKGVVSARNLGIKNSSGRYIAFLDADDIWHYDFLEESINIRKESIKPIAITHASYFRFKVVKNKIQSTLVEPPALINNKNILKKNYMPLLTVLIDRQIIKELNFENQRPEDYRLWIDLIYIKKFESISIKKELGFYRVSEKQRSKNKIYSIFRIYRLFCELPDSNIYSQNINTLNWIIYNSFQRIFLNRTENKEKLLFLKSLIIK